MKEHHLILRGRNVGEVAAQERELLAGHPSCRVIFKRWFLSDAPLQAAQIPPFPGAMSVIGQMPLDGSAAALWLWLAEGADSVEYSGGVTVVRADGVEHTFHASLVGEGAGSEQETSAILDAYEADLAARGMKIDSDCLRTWFFCNDIDNNYAGLVKARRENFAVNGLTADTHYIASTGIAGVPPDGSTVQMDAWSAKGDISQRFLYARTHLNPTSEYGVTFERGVRVDYSGAAHCVISGTASIDNKGAVLHVGDVAAQTGRMLENISKLLEEGGAAMSDIKVALVYLRNGSDYSTVKPLIDAVFDGIPHIITIAPVCRPTWLIETECIAVKALPG